MSTYTEDSMAQWLRALTAILKINGSNPDVVKEIFLSKIVLSNIFLSYTNHSLTITSKLTEKTSKNRGHIWSITKPEVDVIRNITDHS